MVKDVKTLIGYEGNTKEITYQVPDNEPGLWGKNYNFETVGEKRLQRLDAIEKVTGKAKYPHDMNRPGMLHARLVTCPYPHARIISVNTSEAEKMPGVRAVEKFDGVEGSTARFAGWLVAAVAADTIQQARDAARQVKVEYRELPFVIDPEEARYEESPRVSRGGNVNETPNTRQKGDIDKGFQEADVIIEGNYSTQVQTHSCLETHGCTAEWNDDGELTVWHSTQGIWTVSQGMARAFNIAENKSRCISQYMGGGFGSKFGPEEFGIMAAKLAKITGKPVKLFLDRYEDTVMAGNKPGAQMYVKVGAKQDGTLTALYLRNYYETGYTGGGSVAVPFFEHYDCPNVKADEYNVHTNAGSARAFRAPGRPQGCWGLEMALEDLAMKLNMDSYELRAKNVKGWTLKALPYELELGAQKFGWKDHYKPHGSNEGKIKKGVGCVVTFWGQTGRPGGADVRCTINKDGSVEVANGSQDLGTGHRTMMAAVAAEELAIDINNIKVSIGDTNLGLNGPASGGSVTCPTVSPAVRSAAYRAKQKLFEKVAQKLKTEIADLESKSGNIISKSDGNKTISWNDACALLRDGSIVAMGEHVQHPEPTDEQKEQGIPEFGSGAYGAQFAEVEVDTETGHVCCKRIVAVQDIGKTLALQQTESQICGGVIQGVSYALMENRIMDNMTGRQINPNMDDYKILNSSEMPDIEPVVVDVYDPVNNTGAKGLGEPPHIPTAAAIGCAVANAIGIPIRDLPITPDKVLAALQEKEG